MRDDIADTPSSADWSAARELDLRGLKCPLPAIKTTRALATMAPGARLIVGTTDPMSVVDIPHAVATAGGRLVSRDQDGRVWIFRIER